MNIKRALIVLTALMLLPVAAFAQVPTTAFVQVSKYFEQSNTTTPVTFNIECVSGNISPPTFTATYPFVTPNKQFSVVDIDPALVGDNKCTVWETPVAGYVAKGYCSGDGEPNVDCNAPLTEAARIPVCIFDDVDIGDTAVCGIHNTAAPVKVEVTKIWDTSRTGGDFYDRDATITISCDAQIVGGSGPIAGVWSLSKNLVDPTDYIQPVGTPPKATDTNMGKVTAYVIPTWYPTATPQKVTKCWANEDPSGDSAVESESTCGSTALTATMKVPVGGPGGTCEITNTVFFEGIPTLNQYGMAIMALLMLGVGFVGFRRFV